MTSDTLVDFKNVLASGIDSFSSGRTKTFFLFFSNPIHQVLPTFLNPIIPGNLHLPCLPNPTRPGDPSPCDPPAVVVSGASRNSRGIVTTGDLDLRSTVMV